MLNAAVAAKSEPYRMQFPHYNLVMSLLACMVVACSNPIPNETANVWDSYDVRHPVPAGVPDSYARQYDQYIDNDSYYSMPDCSIMDSPSCSGSD